MYWNLCASLFWDTFLVPEIALLPWFLNSWNNNKEAGISQDGHNKEMRKYWQVFCPELFPKWVWSKHPAGPAVTGFLGDSQLQHPNVSLRPSTCLSRVHFGYSATQATTEFLNYRNNPVQPLKLVLLQFNLYFKNKIKSMLSISCTNDFPRKLILKLIHWLVLCRKKMLKSLNT